MYWLPFNLLTNQAKALKAHKKAQELDEAGHAREALQLYFKALSYDEMRPTTHYNIALIAKYQADWATALAHNKRAVELSDHDEAAIWNLGIAATALEEWEEARAAWKSYGIDIRDGNGEVDHFCGHAAVRLFSKDKNCDPEVVWGERIDPARMRINNIPFPVSGYRYGDIVLNDGAPNGVRLVGEKEFNVFDCLGLHKASDYSTYSLRARVKSPEDVEQLENAIRDADFEIEDWTASTRNLCAECSEKSVDDKEGFETEEAWSFVREIGLASEDEMALRDIIDQWQNRTSAIILSLDCTLRA